MTAEVTSVGLEAQATIRNMYAGGSPHPALGVPAQIWGLDEMISRGPIQHLPFCVILCDSVITSVHQHYLAEGRIKEGEEKARKESVQERKEGRQKD